MQDGILRYDIKQYNKNPMVRWSLCIHSGVGARSASSKSAAVRHEVPNKQLDLNSPDV
jgi:hypothetical protein